jgi:Flp pilus assembly secretin CpaC
VLATLLSAPAAFAEGTIRVNIDYARVLKFDRPVAKVIVGNSDIADAAVADAKTIILTGKSFGTTNLVILDEKGEALVDERVLVSLENYNTLQVYRQTDRQVLSCTPNCEPLETSD